VVLIVKPIYGTRIRNDVVDGVEMDEVKLRYIEIMQTQAKVVICTKLDPKTGIFQT
jgi:hypothetical protein